MFTRFVRIECDVENGIFEANALASATPFSTGQ
jgi:hypothetical protein